MSNSNKNYSTTMMDYRFNYGMLSSWMAANPGFTKTSVARALGFTDQAAMTRWISGDKAIPTEHLLRFCNTFQVPLESFFFDNEAMVTLSLKRPAPNDQTEPNGGYIQKNSKGGAHLPSPIPKQRIACNMPDMSAQKNAKATTDTDGTTAGTPSGTQQVVLPQPQIDVTQIFIAYQEALERTHREYRTREDDLRQQYETKWAKERDAMLETIRQQRQELEKYRNRGMRYGMVGEDEI